VNVTISLAEQLTALGLQPGAAVIVHTAFSRVGPLPGGPEELIAVLREVLTSRGTLVMPSMSDDDDHPFDVAATPCRGMGIVADTFWRMPGVLRSDSPHAFAAIGPHAAAITAAHPFDVPHGLDSPVGRVWQLDGQVLLLGVGHDANTTIHLAENMAAVPYKLAKHLTVLRGGRAVRVEYEEIDHCCARFAFLDEWLGSAQHIGPVGRGVARLARSGDIIHSALAALQSDATVFLHPRGECGECDAARHGIRHLI
jgi:aminoglycoside N3'-acetyltransferase